MALGVVGGSDPHQQKISFPPKKILYIGMGRCYEGGQGAVGVTHPQKTKQIVYRYGTQYRELKGSTSPSEGARMRGLVVTLNSSLLKI